MCVGSFEKLSEPTWYESPKTFKAKVQRLSYRKLSTFASKVTNIRFESYQFSLWKLSTFASTLTDFRFGSSRLKAEKHKGLIKPPVTASPRAIVTNSCLKSTELWFQKFFIFVSKDTDFRRLPTFTQSFWNESFKLSPKTFVSGVIFFPCICFSILEKPLHWKVLENQLPITFSGKTALETSGTSALESSAFHNLKNENCSTKLWKLASEYFQKKN